MLGHSLQSLLIALIGLKLIKLPDNELKDYQNVITEARLKDWPVFCGYGSFALVLRICKKPMEPWHNNLWFVKIGAITFVETEMIGDNIMLTLPFMYFTAEWVRWDYEQ